MSGYECRLTYRSKAARITSDSDSLRDAATSRARAHKSADTRNVRSASLGTSVLDYEFEFVTALTPSAIVEPNARHSTTHLVTNLDDANHADAIGRGEYGPTPDDLCDVVNGVEFVTRKGAVRLCSHGLSVYTTVYTRKPFGRLFSEAA